MFKGISSVEIYKSTYTKGYIYTLSSRNLEEFSRKLNLLRDFVLSQIT